MSNPTTLIPTFIQTKFTNMDGSPTTAAKMYLDQLSNNLQQVISSNGLKVPKLNSDQISGLASATFSRLLVFDIDTEQLKFNVNGVFKVVTLT